MNDWTFHNGKTKPPEQWEREGKPEWADMIRLQLNHNQTLQLIEELARRVQNYRAEKFEVVLVGELEKSDDES